MYLDTYKTAIYFALLSSLGFAIQDTVVKLLSETGSIWQLMLIRSLLVIVILWLWARLKSRMSEIMPSRLGWPLTRAIFMSIAYTLFYTTLPFVSLSEAASCFFTFPIFICLFAHIFLKETVGIWRISAIITGFCGALLIIQPGSTEFRAVLILPVFAGAFYALGVTITRGFCKDQPSLALTGVHNFLYACIGALAVSFIPILQLDYNTVSLNPFLFQEWAPLSKGLILMICATSLTHIVSMTASIKAYQSVQAVLIAPIEYSYLIFAAAIDYFLWQTIPTASHSFGALIIFLSGSLIAVREWSNSKNKT